jgi:rieske iron-sulfur protein
MAEENSNLDKSKGIDRRVLMRWIMGVGAISSMAALGSVLGAIKIGSTTEAAEIQPGDRLVFALGTNRGAPVTHTSILPGEGTLAYPAGKEVEKNLLMILHLGTDAFSAPTDLRWVPQGFIAYSAICTHLGCTVYYSHEPMEQVPYPHLHCPCHGGIYNPLAGGAVVSGPPPRPLSQLPIEIRPNGEIVAAGPFSGPIGPSGG